MQFTELKIEEYGAFARQHEQANFLSSTYQYELKKKAGYEVYLLGVKEDDVLLGAAFIIGAPVLHIYRYFYAPRGPLMNYHDKTLVTFFFNHIRQFLKDKKGLYFKFDPYVFYQEHDHNGDIVKDGFHNQDCIDHIVNCDVLHSGFTTGFNDSKQVRWMMTLPLNDKDEASILQNMDQLRKRIIKKIQKSDYLHVRELPREEYPLFEEIVAKTSQRKGFYNRELAYYTSLYDAFGKQQCKAMIAYVDLSAYKAWAVHQMQIDEQSMAELKQKEMTKKSEAKLKLLEASIEVNQKHIAKADSLQAIHGDTLILSTAFFILYGNEVLYLSGGSYQEYNSFNGPYAIQWHMIKTALEQGYPRYNFYGTSGDFTKSAADYGVFEFKRGFHAIAEELIGDFYLPLRKTAFTMYNKVKHIV